MPAAGEEKLSCIDKYTWEGIWKVTFVVAFISPQGARGNIVD
jgi:hypothetical protein